jgi:predicted amidohydrolase YtcJ
MTQTFRKAAAPFLPLSFRLAVSIAGAQAPANSPSDRVYRNGVIFTADSQHRTAEALAIRDGRIVYVGDDRGLTPFVGGATVTVDLKGRFLMPGLVDGHMHPLEAGLQLLKSISTMSR